MRKTLIAFLFFVLCTGMGSSSMAQVFQAPNITAQQWILIDMVSGQTLGAKEANKKMAPMSLTKMMTAYLVFGAIKEGNLQLNQTVTASERAFQIEQGGSKMFIDTQTPVRIKDLLYGLIVHTGNDAAVALAEAVSGNEESFVTLMNHEAVRLGMANTRFSNSHGLADRNNYSTPRDLSILATHLIRNYPEFYKIYSVRDFTFNGIRQQNKNRLLWLDSNVDGITGNTDNNVFSLIASASRESAIGERRMLAIVIGVSTNQLRTQESLKLLNWGFQNFDTLKLYDRRQPIATPSVWKGSPGNLPIGFNFDAYVSVPRGAMPRLQSVLERNDPLVAPIAENSRVGTLKMILDGQVIAELPVVALERVNISSGFRRLMETIQSWVKK